MCNVVTGEFAAPRKVKPGVPRALEAICLKAMALRPEGRYATVVALAADVERWLADEPTTAWREPWTERTRRWTRRHRTLVASLGVLLLTTTMALAVGLWLVNAEKNRTKLAEAETKKALAQVTEEQGKTQAALEKSQAAEANAKEQRQLALDTVKSVVTDIDAQLKNKPALQELRKKLLKTAENGLKKVARNAETAGQIDHETIWVHFELGDIFLDLDGATAEARKQYQAAHALAQKLADDDQGNAQAQRDLSISLEKLGDVQLRLGDTKAALDYYRRDLDICQKLADDKGNAEAQRDLSVSFNKLGDVQLQLGDTKAALDSYRRSLDIRQKLADDDPRDARAQYDLFVTYWKLGAVEKDRYEYSTATNWFSKARTVVEPLHEAGKLTMEQKQWIPLVAQEIDFCTSAEKAVADLDFALKQPETLVPQLLAARIRAWHQKSKHAEVAATADKFHTLADLPGNAAGNNIYIAAKGYALASTCADADDKTKQAHAAKAVALLKEARDKGFFKAKTNVEHAKKDPDLDALRQRDDFKALLAELEKDAK
jgi:tetratricopeptide (TPR) repeat protein